MCGIIGYTGKENATERILKGLDALEYRGYDSAGICGFENGFSLVKTKGRVKFLREKLEKAPINSNTAIGHTRWATHGSPSDENAHPHIVGDVCIVHNGIIENYKKLRLFLLEKGYSFKSETDTEIACGLIDYQIKKENDISKGIVSATKMLEGAYALAIMVKGERDSIYAIRKGSPLVIGMGQDEFYLSSDITALLPFTRTYFSLLEGVLINLKKDRATLFGGGEIPWQRTDMDYEQAQKGGYAHFMLKEIYEQPGSIKNALSPRIKNGLPSFLEDGLDNDFFKGIENIQIVACGSAMHAGLLASYGFEELGGVGCQAFVASEYRYTPPKTAENTLLIVVSQSGETADTIASLRYGKGKGLKTLAIVNTVESTIAREADYTLYTYAGPEIAVATTKGYTTQVSLLYLLALAIGEAKGIIEEKDVKSYTQSLFFDTQRVISAVLERQEEIIKIARKIYQKENIFYIGRGVDYAICQEASLKLKEISYIHSEAYPSGELKHGTISLIEENTPVIAMSTEKRLYEKLYSNIKEAKSRGAYTILIGSGIIEGADHIFTLPRVNKISEMFGAIAFSQLLAYHISLLRGCDIDKPRNLAKSVTVE